MINWSPCAVLWVPSLRVLHIQVNLNALQLGPQLAGSLASSKSCIRGGVSLAVLHIGQWSFFVTYAGSQLTFQMFRLKWGYISNWQNQTFQPLSSYHQRDPRAFFYFPFSHVSNICTREGWGFEQLMNKFPIHLLWHEGHSLECRGHEGHSPQ